MSTNKQLSLSHGVTHGWHGWHGWRRLTTGRGAHNSSSESSCTSRADVRQCGSVCFGALPSPRPQQLLAGLVWHDDRVVIGQHASWVARHGGHGRGVLQARGGQQPGEVFLCDADARVLERLGVRVAALPLLEEQRPARVGGNPRLMRLLDMLPGVLAANVPALVLREEC